MKKITITKKTDKILLERKQLLDEGILKAGLDKHFSCKKCKLYRSWFTVQRADKFMLVLGWELF